jgi:hypothetical protein
MKKKIINGILMVALVAATSTSFVSCKDNDEDVKTDLIYKLDQEKANLQRDFIQADNDLMTAIKTDIKDPNSELAKAFNAWVEAKKYATEDWVKDWCDKENDYLKSAEFPDTLAKYLKTNTDFVNVTNTLWGEDGKSGLVKDVADALAQIKINRDSIKTLNARIDTVNHRIGTIIEALRNMVTSVTINATSNSILSNSKVFPGLDMQIVGAAYGEPINAQGQFPSKQSGLSEDAIAGVENLKGFYKWQNNQLITNEDENGYNAGKMYFTLNPSNTNPNKLKSLTLVNSQNTEIFKLGTVTESKEVLTWGITRADGDTFEPTLWEAPIKYDATSVKALELKNIINFSALKNNVKNIINAAKDVDSKSTAKSSAKTVLKETATAVANLLNSKIPAMPAVALKATWEDTVGVRSVLSDYSIAATAYKPLSFSEFNGVSLGTDINFTKVDNGFKKILDKVRNELKGIDLSGLKIGTITIDDYNDYNKSQTVWIKITTTYENKPGVGVVIDKVDIDLTTTTKDAAAPSGYSNNDSSNGGTKAGKKVTVTSTDVDADMSAAIQTLIEDKVNGTLKSTNKAIQDVVDQVKNVIKKANDGLDKVGSLEKSVTDYLESFISRTINFVSTGRFLEPILLVNSNDGIRRATGTYEAGKYTFVPTTMNYELIAPAFKKYIAVLDKNGKVIAGSQKILTKGDKDFSSVELELTTDAAQIVYAAMDFRGYQVAKVYNVTVK